MYNPGVFGRRSAAGGTLNLAAALLALALCFFTSGARASELDQFQNARAAYESLNYELAVDLFSNLLSDASPTDRRPLVIESRKYLAASYMFVGRPADGERELRALLEVEPDYVLDPLSFPAEVQRSFARIKAELAEERADRAVREAREMAEKRQAEERAKAVESARLARLIELARTERRITERSRIIAMIPFGVGQFQNGHDGLGLLLAVTEGVLLAGSITAYAFHEHLRGQEPAENRLDDARLAEGAFRYINLISFGMFTVVAITGVVDAQLRFRENVSVEVRRPLPPDLEPLDKAKPTVSLGVSPLGLNLAGSF